MKKRSVAAGAAAALIGLVGAPTVPNYAGNLFLTITSDAFYIPRQSTMIRFRPTVMNGGSGEWWLYGEDARYFYAMSDYDHFSYLYLPRDKIAAGINPLDKATWGEGTGVDRVGR